MNEEERNLDLALAECEQENRLLRARNERLTEEVRLLTEAKSWVGLTPEEVKEISLANRPYVVDMVVALEARLKEKNHGT